MKASGRVAGRYSSSELLTMNPKNMLLVLIIGYGSAAAEKVVTVSCEDIKVKGGYEFLAKDHVVLDKNKLTSEEWTEESVMKAYIEYDPPVNDSDPTILEVSFGEILRNICKSVNYTATLNDGFQKLEISLWFVVKDDPEDTGSISWIIALGTGFLVIVFFLGLPAYLWWRKKNRSQNDVTAVSPDESQSLRNEVEHSV
ncbi:uncharacterized protein LOC125717578 isoform X2 [Brienomyrus brachyistius]|uniref:uncharacterized protein LOC125717578 isoform X2 n=1 Tax=Brienomyrus brachyistius TaxID=42636 RepID=UPI0020B1E126|nr:uncharacterized protein LOC125717578 isoform X2 [Brienomyrus brachyistius]